jgi:hypothetical protein
MNFKRVFPVLLLGAASLWAEETIVPVPIELGDVTETPYRYNGVLFVQSAVGSASAVGEGVMATAAHVIFDDEALAWEPIGIIKYFPQYHRPTPLQPVGSGTPMLGFARWTSYSTRVENDDSGPGLSSPDTFNIDFAVGRISSFARDRALLEYPEVNIDAEGDIGILRDQREKMIAGYPADSDFIDRNNRGLMHMTAPADYFCWWGGLTDFPNTWRDSEDFWVATYDFEGVTTYGGNSGGPMYVRTDQGDWAQAGVVVGSNGSDGVFIRGIDDEAWALIEQAIEARGDAPVHRVTDLTATQEPDVPAVRLAWSDTSTGEAGVRVYRMDTGLWEEIADLPADSTEFLDETTRTGHVYHYRVQPYVPDGGRPPRSPSATIRVSGQNSLVAGRLSQPFLNLRNTGDTNWHIDDQNRLRAGQVRSMGQSSIELEIVGPGTLEFTWGVSSEENVDYDNPDSPNNGSIYDAAFLYLNGEQVMDGEEPVFLSGLEGPVTESLAIPRGAHVVEWRYEKDPYTTENEDTAFLESLSWTPDPESAFPIFGSFAFGDSGWNGSEWFGVYSADDFPWIGHLNLGWIYLRPTNGINLSAYSQMPEIGEFYTSPFLYPYFYLPSSSRWVMYVEETGVFGSGAWFYDLTGGEYFLVE